MSTLKPDANQIKNFLTSLGKKDWIKRTERHWWPKFVFHYTDIRNADKILREGYLYSRKYLEDKNRLEVSSGSPSILAGTNPAIKDCVRLYFRPKTPTQYYMEGIRSKATLSSSRFPEAHCPVPVFFLFNSVEILSRADCRFSDMGLGSPNSAIFSTGLELEKLPWRKIYHTGVLNTNDSDIVPRRNAEVIIPRRLDLKTLLYIYCRSEAERETLIHLFPQHLRNQYQNKIIATTRSTLFYRQHTFIENVLLLPKTVDIQFSPETKSRGPFLLKIKIEADKYNIDKKIEKFTLPPYKYKIKLPVASTKYTISIHLDEHLAYLSKYEEMDIPF